ncbi:sulfite exporter TauE/SafE family protein [Alcaligenes faecalis]|uniref:sulfite exporter TauE/SafE family protein n=1 Tax=Alcaligenes faecalis TaxID=511 RepID=UPI001F32F38B|nr:sulfite exporter TauE/SafE family protein [Alcaligenes faecalis]MBW4790385.1 sulfite exporter TauE/SafE family protein [Alcaligenes faecalis subsp. faecalis]
MNWTATLLLLLIIGIGTYFQTVTGFGLAMIVIGINSAAGLTDMPFIASVVSLVSLVNSGVALPRHLHHIDWRLANTTLLGVIPASILGVVLLNFLNTQATSILELLLGCVISYGGITFALRPQQHKEMSRLRSFFSVGFISGLCGGLFGIPGPPIIFHLYRQPISLTVTRNMLLLIFACTAFSRSLYEFITTGFPEATLTTTLLAVPCVALVTLLTQRFPPPVSVNTVRHITFATLILIGASLIVRSLGRLL